MADGLISTLNREMEQWISDINRANDEIKRLEDKKRHEVEYYDREIEIQRQKAQSAETQRRQISEKIMSREREIDYEERNKAS